MALEEMSGNVRRSTDRPRGKVEPHGASSELVAPPDAVLSMLRTTTELGDLGQFSSGPSRLPRSASRVQTTRARSGSFDTSFASALRHQRSPYARPPGRNRGPRPVHSTSTLSARHTSHSNLSSYAPSTRSRRHPPGRHPYPLQGLASPSPSLYTHRSLVTLRSNRDVYSIRSDSPGGPPARMRMRPPPVSSPSFTENRSLHTPQPGFMRAPSTGTVASSPASMYRRHGPFLGYRHNMNGSYTSLQRLPSPGYPPNPHHFLPGTIQTPTPWQQPFGVSSGSTISLRGIPQSPTGSTTPAYYDYSESFAEENCFSPEGDHHHEETLPPAGAAVEGAQTPGRHAQTPFGTMLAW